MKKTSISKQSNAHILEKRLVVGIDIGGTFTDFVIYHPASGQVETFKLLSTPHDPAQAVLTGLERLLGAGQPACHVIHGSTVATNALLERKGARMAFVATRGFGDILQIGRQNRPELYDWSAAPPPPLAPDGLRFELDERIDRFGQVLIHLDPAQVDDIGVQIKDHQAESAAICLLFSFLNPTHEQLAAEKLRAAGLFVSASHEVLPEYREYERGSTTAVNAYVSPVLSRYLANLENGLERLNPEHSLRVMQSNGGSLGVEMARRNGVQCILSGPAGGVVGARYTAELAFDQSSVVKVIAFDMGGTSTDVSLIDGAPQITTEAIIGGCPIRVPALDIHTIGAGGGSIAYLDAGGALRVGPQSAGADPGPACYGKSDLPTVTDANLALGRLAAEHFLGGRMPLDEGRALAAIQRLGKVAGLESDQAALGIIAVANAHMERALRLISVERGRDPRDFTLLSFGGSGGLHAVDLARRLGIPRVLAPPLASTLSAFGMLAADVIKDYAQTIMLPGDTPLEPVFNQLVPMLQRGRMQVMQEGIPADQVETAVSLDMRYRGQSYELNVPFKASFRQDFHTLHRATYGYARPEAALEIVNLRLRVVGRVQPPRLLPQPSTGSDPAAAFMEDRLVTLNTGKVLTPFYRGEALQPGNHINGPAVVVRADTTILIGPSDRAEVDAYSNLIIHIGD